SLRSDPKAIDPGCGSNTAFEAALQ
ncbi:hypothetical protein L195_g064173, partial [Trifolium pratense]